jgi:hypothetical protein
MHHSEKGLPVACLRCDARVESNCQATAAWLRRRRQATSAPKAAWNTFAYDPTGTAAVSTVKLNDDSVRYQQRRLSENL